MLCTSCSLSLSLSLSLSTSLDLSRPLSLSLLTSLSTPLSFHLSRPLDLLSHPGASFSISGAGVVLDSSTNQLLQLVTKLFAACIDKAVRVQLGQEEIGLEGWWQEVLCQLAQAVAVCVHARLVLVDHVLAPLLVVWLQLVEGLDPAVLCTGTGLDLNGR